MARTTRICLYVSFCVVGSSALFWLFGPTRQPGELAANRLWVAGVGLLLGAVVIIGAAMTLVWLFHDRKPIRSVAVEIAGLAASVSILVGVMAVGVQVDTGLYDAQLDIVQMICAEGFRDPSSLERYGDDKLAIGAWDYVAIWEDETRNAIWIDSCGSLSACGVVCIRPGVALAASTQDYPYVDFKYLRENLYAWD